MALNIEALNIAKTKIRESLSLPDYYMDYVDESLDLDRYNRDCCPLHDEDSPSFFYFEDSGRFHCFGCDKSGFVTDLHFYLKLREDESFTQVKAVLELSKLYKIEIPNLFKEASIEEKSKLPKYEKLGFKRKEELQKPLKKVETDFEIKLKKSKHFLKVEDYKELVNKWDKVLFKKILIEENLKILEKELIEKIGVGEELN